MSPQCLIHRVFQTASAAAHHWISQSLDRFYLERMLGTCDDEGRLVDLTGIPAQDIVITQAIIEPERRKALPK